MKLSILLICFYSSFLYANPTSEIFKSVESGQYRKAKLLVTQNKDNIVVEDEFGDKINKSDEVLELISKIQKQKSSCDKEIADTEEEKLPEGTDFILEEFKKDCLEKGTLGSYSDQINATYKYKNFLKTTFKDYNQRYVVAKNKWDQLEQEFQKEQNEKEKYTKTANYSLEETCKAVKMVQHFSKLMSEEERAAKRSGFVNKASMHSWGKSLEFWMKSFNSHKQDYKNRSKKIFKNSNCK